jgi:hypothetical protein
VGTELSDDERRERLARAIERARFARGTAEGQSEWAHDRIASALAVYMWQCGQDAALGPPPRTEGKHLVGVIKAAKALREHLHALPADVQIALGVPPGEFQQDADAQSFVALDPLKELVEKAERMQQQRKGGRPSNEALEALLLAITVQWRCAFDPEPENNPLLGIVYHGNAPDDAERYTGPLLDFAVDILHGQGIRYGVRSALGRRLYDLMMKKWEMSRHENPPSKSH